LNTDTYISLLANPQIVDPQQLTELSSVIEKYPYFQSARALQLKGLKNQSSFLYNDALKVTAAHTSDRDILFEYITSKEFIQNDISERIQINHAEVDQIEVVSENISFQIHQEVEAQHKSELEKAEAILDPRLFERKQIAQIEEEVPEPETSKSIATEKIETPQIEPDAPLAFTKKDTHSFTEWLLLTQAKPIDRSSETQVEKPTPNDILDKQRKFELIEKFIQQPPKLKPKLASEKQTNLAKPYTEPQDALMTETLAKVYLQQKKYKKAIQAYKILILKNPEKSGFFADQIRAIQKLITKEQ